MLKVRTYATNNDIIQAVVLLFEVQVDGVQVVNVKGNNNRFQQAKGRRNDWK